MDYSAASNEELERLVNNKDGDAICELGERCMYGTGGHEMNLTRAYQLFHRGEKMGLPRAYIGLGEMYRNGIRLAKNEDVAKQYYKKAGVPYPERESALQQQKNSMFQTPSKIQFPGNLISEGITSAEIKSKLDSAEQARMGGDYCRAGILCMEVIGIAKDVLSGAVNYSGSGDVEDFLTEANWILAYAAFNEQNYLEMDHYLAFRGVLEAHPWGAYLKAAAHRSMQSPPALLEQDLQMMFAIVSGNRNLSQDERGDICAMIGDLITDGYGVNFGMESGMAKSYYEEAMNCGNEYAKERYQEIN